MRSKTFTPLLQFTNWLGIDPFKAAGIDIEYGQISTNPNRKCKCTLQYDWQSADGYSRDNWELMLEYAENTFYQEAYFYPGPYQILDEEIAYPDRSSLNTGYRIVEPFHSCKFLQSGVLTLEFLGYFALTRDIAGTIQNNFTATIPVPAGTLQENIKIFFTETDGGYVGALEYNDSRQYEIRPLNNSKLDGTNFLLNEGAYLFKKPSLDEAEDCVAHALDTYVEEIAVYLLVNDRCEQGKFVYNTDNCLNGRCEETTSNLCTQKELVYQNIWLKAFPANCTFDDGEYVYSNYCMSQYPDYLRINYSTGEKLTKTGEIQQPAFSAISKLAIGLSDCVRKGCECDTCNKNKFEYYRSVPKELTEDATLTSQGIGNRYQILLSPYVLSLVEGFPLYRGVIEGLQEIKNLRCLNRGR